MSKLNEFDLALSSLDDELASFIHSLIAQNAELAEKLEHIDSLTELAEKRLVEAGKEAEAIKAVGEREANARAAAIVAEAERKTEGAAQEIIAKAKEKAEAEAKIILAESRQRSEKIAAEVLKKAEEEALLLRKQAEQRLATSEQTAKSPAEVSRELCAKLDCEAKAARHVPADVQVEEPIQDTLCAKQEGDAEESTAYYADFVDMVLRPHIALGGMLKLYKQLYKYPGVKVIAVTGSLDKGLWIRFIVRAQTPLLSVFEALAEVRRISYAVIEVGKIFSAQKEYL